MINGAHVGRPEQECIRDQRLPTEILGRRERRCGPPLLIFDLPTAEVAFHPTEEKNRYELYLMCDDLKNEMAALQREGGRVRWSSRSAVGIDNEDPVARRRRNRLT